MRNPLKKLQKKINLRLANNAAQHSQPSGKEADVKPTHADRSLSSTELESDDPLFNNRSSKLRLALAESKKTNAQQQQKQQQQQDDGSTTPKKKKKGIARLSFGGSHTGRKTQAVGTVQEEEATEGVVVGKGQSLSTKVPIRTPPRGVEGKAGFDSSTLSQQNCKAKAEVYPSNVAAAQRTAAVAPPKHKLLDPNLERIAKAAAALDNTGNALFEKGEYDKAMASYVKALKLKNRTLAGAQWDDFNPLAANGKPNLPESGSSSNLNPSSHRSLPRLRRAQIIPSHHPMTQMYSVCPSVLIWIRPWSLSCWMVRINLHRIGSLSLFSFRISLLVSSSPRHVGTCQGASGESG